MDSRVKQALILVGGKGTRLGNLTSKTPKPMLCVGGRPFLEYVILNLKISGINKIILSAGYLPDKITDFFHDGYDDEIEIQYICEDSPAGTGGALKFASEKLDKRFLVLNGDTLFDINYLDLALLQFSTDSLASIALRHTDNASQYGSVFLNGTNIEGFHEKANVGPAVISGGVYVMQKDVLDLLPSGASSIENDLFPLLTKIRRLTGKVYEGFFIDIGLPETLKKGDIDVPKWYQEKLKIMIKS
ncbi:MAG: NTP transferase domain-containing protein [Desulfobacterales bacterium]|nr:NTP transferase domain-containing protein [Desulfobacterales bacterium]MBF0396163.1 NTP transferase domain-containing protein [Desulfobacterales bacterium]